EPSSRPFPRGQTRDAIRRRFRNGSTAVRETAGWNGIRRQQFEGRLRGAISGASARLLRAPRKEREPSLRAGLGKSPLRGLLFCTRSGKENATFFFGKIFSGAGLPSSRGDL